jgi:hypothetical protein
MRFPIRVVYQIPILNFNSRKTVDKVEWEFWSKALRKHFGNDRANWPNTVDVNHKIIDNDCGVIQELWVGGRKLAAFNKDAIDGFLVLIGEIY